MLRQAGGRTAQDYPDFRPCPLSTGRPGGWSYGGEILHRAQALAGRRSAPVLLVVTAAGLAAGGIAALAGAGSIGDAIWLATAAAGLIYALWVTGGSIFHGRIGVDLIAVLAVAGAMAVG